MTYYQLPNKPELSAFQLFLHTGQLPLNWHKFKGLRRARPQAPVLLACFVLFVVSYVSFVVIRVCDGQEQHVCTDNFLLQPPVGLPLTTAEVFQENSQLGQSDKKLLDYIRRSHIFPPSEHSSQIQGKKNASLDSMAVGQFVSSLLNSQPGFFVEVNCPNWEMSKTLMLERDLGWKGVLIEADPKAFSDLRRKQRKAFLADVCLSTSDKPQEVTVNQPFPRVRIPAQRSPQHSLEDTVFEEIELKCLPIFSILATLNKTTVDFFSLNAHGAELKVLQTIPFHSLFIKIFSIENILHIQGRRSLMDFMASKGYQQIPWNFKRNKSNFLFVHTKISSMSKILGKGDLQIYNN